jgi:hypothetical protein
VVCNGILTTIDSDFRGLNCVPANQWSISAFVEPQFQALLHPVSASFSRYDEKIGHSGQLAGTESVIPRDLSRRDGCVKKESTLSKKHEVEK